MRQRSHTRFATLTSGWVALTAGCAHFTPRPADVASRVTEPWVARRLECLDVRVAALREPLAPAGAPVFALAFVDRCDGPAAVDLSKVRVRATLDDGTDVALELFDPGHELHPALLAAGREGAEALEFDPPRGHGAPLAARRVCVELDAIAGGSASASPVCFEAQGEGLVPLEAGRREHVEGRALPPRETSVVVGYRRFGESGAGWEEHHDEAIRPHVPADLDRVRVQGPLAGYALGSLPALGDSPSARSVEAGCTDVRVEAVRADLPKTSLALAFRIGNRCARAVRVALANVRVQATWADGRRRDLALYDPASEVHAPVLDARGRAEEILEYQLPPDSPDGPAQSVCVDVSRIAGTEPAPVAPVCLSRREGYANRDTIVGHLTGFDPEGWRRIGWRGVMEIGLGVRYLDLHGMTWGGTASSGRSFQVDASKLGGSDTFEIEFRYLTWVGGPVYVGGMFWGGVGATDTNLPFMAAGVRTRSYGSLGDFAGGVVGGASTTGTGPMRLRFDVTAGVRAILSELYPNGCGDSRCEWDVSTVRPLVAPRVVLDARVSPWFTVAAWADADALYLPGFGVGLSATLHLWGYDGLP